MKDIKDVGEMDSESRGLSTERLVSIVDRAIGLVETMEWASCVALEEAVCAERDYIRYPEYCVPLCKTLLKSYRAFSGAKLHRCGFDNSNVDDWFGLPSETRKQIRLDKLKLYRSYVIANNTTLGY